MCNARKGFVFMKKVKFNFVDVIVVLLVVAVVGFVGLKFFGGGFGAGGASTYEVKYLCDEVPTFAASVIKVGDPILDEQKETNLGEVTDVRIGESRTYTTTKEGDVRLVPKEGYNSVEITSIVEGEDYDFGMIAGSSKYGVGHSITIRVGKAKIFGRVSGIEKID